MEAMQLKAEASRVNSLRSTGPTSEAGKKVSSRNSRKHGLLCKALVVADEEVAVFEAFEADLVKELCPVGVVETVLVEQLAGLYWRRARAERIETELFEQACATAPAGGSTPMGDAFLAISKELLLVQRYTTPIVRELERVRKALRVAQIDRKAEDAALYAKALEAERLRIQLERATAVLEAGAAMESAETAAEAQAAQAQMTAAAAALQRYRPQEVVAVAGLDRSMAPGQPGFREAIRKSHEEVWQQVLEQADAADAASRAVGMTR